MRCNKCDSEMKEKRSFGAIDYYCEKCGNSFTCIFSEEIELDENEYELKLEKNEPSSNNIKIISKICNCNFIQAREIIVNNSSIFKGKAVIIMDIKNELDNNNIKYSISPSFNY